jgi:hypothetical protein
VEGSKLCLFSVIMPAKCVSSVSPRFHYKRLAFCFLPLAAILESSKIILFIFSFCHFSNISKERRLIRVIVSPTNCYGLSVYIPSKFMVKENGGGSEFKYEIFDIL